MKRLTTVLAATPYLGLTVDDELVVKTVTAGGPAGLAGLKVGDRLAKLGMTAPATTDDLRAALERSSRATWCRWRWCAMDRRLRCP